MIANVAKLALWEWFKLQRRWMLWVLLAFAILFAQLAVWGSFSSYNNLQSTGGEVTVPRLGAWGGAAAATDNGRLQRSALGRRREATV